MTGGREKIAFVCQRYGLEVNGGAELHCRQLAERMAARYDVTVYTTCALDYITWKNHYAAGEEMISGVRVKRFPVERERDKERFDRISDRVFSDPSHTDEEEKEWIEEQGPFCPELIRVLREERRTYRVVFFMTYLYYLTATGLTDDFENAMLIPTVHDEPPVYLRHYEKVFNAAKAIAWNTEEEKAFAEKRFPSIRGKKGILAGVGIDESAVPLPEIPEKLRGTRYLVYAGRIDESKGCREMMEAFRRYRDSSKSGLKLVLVGKPVMDIPKDPDIIPLGFVSDEMKLALMRDAFALVLFSKYESLSMVVLESMMMGRPVIVTGQCKVLKGHCVRSNAGLYFNGYAEFEGCVSWLLAHPEAYEVMCENGRRYVKENYCWGRILDKFSELIQNEVGSRK